MSVSPLRLLRLARYLLNDEHGISESAWVILKPMLLEADCLIPINRVISSEGRFFLPEANDGDPT